MQQIDTTRSMLHPSMNSAYALCNASVGAQAAAVVGLNDIVPVSAVVYVAIIPLTWVTKPSKAAGVIGAAARAH